MAQTATKEVLPSIAAFSEAFQDGWKTLESGENTGWPTQYAPREDTLVQFLLTFNAIVETERRNGHDFDYGARWLAGLLAAWLRRTEPYTKGH